VLFGGTIVVADAAGNIVADSRTAVPSLEAPAETELPEREIPIGRIGESEGILYVDSAPGIGTSYSEALADSLDLFLVWGSMLAAVVALILTIVLSRRIAAPVEELAAFARRAGRGDLSARVQITDTSEIGTLAEAMNTMAADLDRAATMRRNIVADTAHEVRTPLSNIIGYLEAYEDGIADRTLVMSSLNEEASILARLVDDLQELATADAGRLNLDCRMVSLETLLERCIDTSRTLAARKGVRLGTDIEAGLPPVYVDPQRVCQVLHNLIKNALAYTEADDTISVAARSATDTASEGAAPASTVEISVSDTGEGIAEAELGHVFERYYRTDASRARATGGSGLGLSIAKRIVEALGGRIHAEVRPGGGTTVVFRLPAAMNSGNYDEVVPSS
ncbi:MAG: ATP-binding protein, partial [Spirochaetia bacterium]